MLKQFINEKIKHPLQGMRGDLQFFFELQRIKKNFLPVTYTFLRQNENTGIFSDLLVYLGAAGMAKQSGSCLVCEGDRLLFQFFIPQNPSGQPVCERITGKKEKRELQEQDICIRPRDSFSFLYGRYQQYFWKKVLKGSFSMKSSFQKKIEEAADSLFEQNIQVLGILYRGTDYKNLQPKGHPVQPGISDVIKKTEEIMRKKHCRKIFLATEDSLAAEKMREYFGQDCVMMYQKRLFSHTGEHYLSELCEQDARKQIAQEYIISMALLARCQYLIAGRTSGLAGVLLLAQKPFAYAYFWDLGIYGENK